MMTFEFEQTAKDYLHILWIDAAFLTGAWKMQVSPKWIIRAAWIVAVILSPYVTWLGASVYCDAFHTLPKQTYVIERVTKPDPSEMEVNGSITLGTPLSIAVSYFTHPVPVKRVLLSGLGGNGAGGSMGGSVLDLLGVPVVVPANHLCASSCVRVMLSSNQWTIDPQGYLLFHAGRNDTPAYDDCQPCLFLKTNWPYGPASTATRHLMLSWAEELSPNFSKFLATCSKNPLDSINGLAVSGEQIEAISADRNSFSCDDISLQNAEWLSNSGLIGRIVPTQ